MQTLPQMKAITEYELVPWPLIPDLGLYMDQVVTYMERQFTPLYGERAKGMITPSMINNYVKSGLLPRPAGKKYNREHLALLMIIATLKPVASMDDITRLTRLPEGESPEAQYEEFRQTLAQVFRSISIDPDSSALRHAVTATAYRLVTEALLEQDG